MNKARGYTDQDWADVSDNPEWTEEDFARAKPFAEVFPDLAESIRRDGIQSGRAEDFILLKLDPEVVARFKASGPDWESRINETLKKAVGL